MVELLNPDAQELYETIKEIYKETNSPVSLTKLSKQIGWRSDKFKRNIVYLEEMGFIKKTAVFQKYIPLKLEEEPIQKEIKNDWWKK